MSFGGLEGVLTIAVGGKCSSSAFVGGIIIEGVVVCEVLDVPKSIIIQEVTWLWDRKGAEGDKVAR